MQVDWEPGTTEIVPKLSPAPPKAGPWDPKADPWDHYNPLEDESVLALIASYDPPLVH